MHMNTQLQSLFQWVGSSDAYAGKDWGQKQKGPTEDEMVGWHRWHNRHEFGQIPRDSEGQGSLACCSPWGCKELDATEWPNNKCTCTTGAFSPVDFRGGGVATGGQTSQEVTTTKLWHLNSEAHLPTKKKFCLITLWWPFWWPEWVSQQLWNRQHSRWVTGSPFRAGSHLHHRQEGDENSAVAREQMPKDLRLFFFFHLFLLIGG